jgi:hypothetical protein
LNRTPASTSSRTTWTLSYWIKASNFGTNRTLLNVGGLASGYGLIFHNDADRIDFQELGGTTARLTTTRVYRDPSAWYHIVCVWDSSNATAANRMRIYTNGVRETAFFNNTNPALNAQSAINTASLTRIGWDTSSTSGWTFGGYLTEVNFIDGQALTPSDFGETDSATGVWKPKAYSGTYGTNGFFLKFADNSGTTSTTLGKDSSGNGNNWTPNNFSVTAGAGNDSLVDSPTAYGTDTGVGGEVRGNYATLNPLDIGSSVSTLSNGNLDVVTPSSGGGTCRSTLGVSSGKWYWEVTPTANATALQIGIVSSTAKLEAYLESCQTALYFISGNKGTGPTGSNTPYGSTITNNDVVGVALDLDAGTLTFYKNGVSMGTAFSSISGTYSAGLGDSSNSISVTANVNFGQRAFAYTAPSGFKALCTTNLPTPTIGATSTTLAGKYFNPVLYTGNGSSQSITGVGFQPDFTWIKSRSGADNHNLFNAVVGLPNRLFSNLTNAENTTAGTLTSFNSDGFSVGSISDVNANAVTFVGWNWNAGGSNATNTSGTITSTVRANTTSGFSIVTYTGTGANATVGHGLGVAPQMVIVKNRDTSATDWPLWHKSLGDGQYRLYLNLTSSSSTASSLWNNTEPTSTTISVGTSNYVNENTKKFVAYCFAPVAGYSAFGSYTGNAAADGPFIYTGFRPEFVMIKASSSTGDWVMEDVARSPYNVSTNYLLANSSGAETTGQLVDFLSNGFKIRVAVSSAMNGSGTTYVYAAFAEAPFKYSLAR